MRSEEVRYGKSVQVGETVAQCQDSDILGEKEVKLSRERDQPNNGGGDAIMEGAGDSAVGTKCEQAETEGNERNRGRSGDAEPRSPPIRARVESDGQDRIPISARRGTFWLFAYKGFALREVSWKCTLGFAVRQNAVSRSTPQMRQGSGRRKREGAGGVLAGIGDWVDCPRKCRRSPARENDTPRSAAGNGGSECPH